ncbi:MAG: hemolysin activation protein [Chloroflexota bacterium]
MSLKKTPIAIFTYNRPKHTQRMLESLANCECLEECDIHLYSDAPRIPEHRSTVEETRHILQEWADKFDAKVKEQDTNIGVAHSIVGQVTDLCARYGRVIVIEDDFVLSPSYLRFMISGLDRYEHEPRVYQISGHTYPVRNFPRTADAFFFPYTTPWGWGTWQRAWKFFEWKPAGMYELLADPKRLEKFDLNHSFRFSKILRSYQNHEGDIYDVVWYYIVYARGGLALYPRTSLVWNGGIDGTGIHCIDDPDYKQTSMIQVSQTRLDEKFKWPSQVAMDPIALDHLKKYLRQEFYSPPPFFKRARQKIDYELNRLRTRLS